MIVDSKIKPCKRCGNKVPNFKRGVYRNKGYFLSCYCGTIGGWAPDCDGAIISWNEGGLDFDSSQKDPRYG